MNDLAQQILDSSPHMTFMVDPDCLRVIASNRIAEQMLGYTREQLLAMDITDIESALQDVFYWEEVRNGHYQRVDSLEGEYRCADGSLLEVGKSVRVLQLEGKPLLLVLARDIRHVRHTEDALEQTLSQLRATLESTGNGILVVDWHGQITSMNRLFSKMWEIPDALLAERNDAAILAFLVDHVVESDVCRARLQEVVDNRETEDLFHLKDGRVFECRSRPQYLGESIIGRVFGYNDITERQRAAEALRESRDQLEARVLERTADLQRANASLQLEKLHQDKLISRLGEAQNQLLQSEKMASIGVLAAGVAHEINNPVGFVNSNVGTLQSYVRDMLKLLAAYERIEDGMEEGSRRDIGQLKQEIDLDFLRGDIENLLSESLDGLNRVKRIVQDLKDFSHVDDSEKHWASLEDGLDSTLNVVWNELKYKVEVIKDYGGIPQIECFASQLNQVFMNLLMNAGHAIEERGQITIRTRHDEDNVWVEVQDTGKGIQPEHMSRIFEPFFTTKPVGKGTGLGLSLSYGIVQKHDGRIDVDSTVGKGTTCRVVLPKQAKSAAQEDARPPKNASNMQDRAA